jgi:hypothetical protein
MRQSGVWAAPRVFTSVILTGNIEIDIDFHFLWK